MTEDELAALTANESFYEAFASHDYRRMDELWASARPVTCIHPGWTVLVGRADVMASWHAILRSDDMPIEATAARVYVVGDAAYVVCFEGARGEPPVLVATNIFAREDGHWKMTHHQAGQLATTPEQPRTGPTN